jgi:tetratricopeptide (TPR) repeat protein/cellulose biosynthesis protein BcsQ
MTKEKKLLPLTLSLYSYRGGTGRTQLCANIAAYLCFEKKQKVLLWDWDMEAPSLHWFFAKPTDQMNQEGTIDLLEAYVRLKRYNDETAVKQKLPYLMSRRYIMSLRKTVDEKGCIDLIPAGNYQNANYAMNVARFDWYEFKNILNGFEFLTAFKTWLQTLDYDYILIDSRTGIADYSGICNIFLPDANIFTVTAQLQSFDGNARIAEQMLKAVETQKHRKPYILPILSRLDPFVKHLGDEWTKKFQETFSKYYKSFFEQIQEQNPDNKLAHRYLNDATDINKDYHWIYNEDTCITYNSELSFGENLLFGENHSKSYMSGFGENVERISEILINARNPNTIPQNINYTDLNKSKIYIDNRKYEVEKDLEQSILYVRIDQTDTNNHYLIDIVLKTNYEGSKQLGRSGERLLIKGVPIQIDATLKRLFWKYQQNLQQSEQALTLPLQEQLQQRETELAAKFKATFFDNDTGKIFADFTKVFDNQRITKLVWAISAPNGALLQFPFELALPLFFAHPNEMFINPHLGLVRTTALSVDKFHLKPSVLTVAPVRVLLVVSLADWQRTDAIAFAPMQQYVMEAIAGLQKRYGHQLLIEFLYPASLVEIDNALRERKHDVVHLSTFAPHDKPVLYLEDANGDLRVVPSADLGAILNQHESLKLLIINILGTQPCPDVERILADYLSSVIVTRFNKSEHLMTLFPTYFYENLLSGKDLIHALNDTRARLYEASKVHYFGQRQHFIMRLPIYAYLTRFMASLIDPIAPTQPKKRFYEVRDFKPPYLIGDNFVGRRHYLIQIQTAMRANEHLCLYGLGGMGKTVLAEAFIHQYAMQVKAEVVVFRGLSQINPKNILDVFNQRLSLIQPERGAVLQQLLESDKDNFKQKLQKLIDYYPPNGKLLILFDNCEDLQKKYLDKEGHWQHKIQDRDLSDFLKYLCERAPLGCQILFTCRYKMVDLETVLKHIQVNKFSLEEQNRLLDQSPAMKKAILTSERTALYAQLDGHPRSYMYLENLLRREKAFEWSQIDSVRTEAFDNLLLQEVYNRLNTEEQNVFEWVASFTTQTEIAVLAAVCHRTGVELLPFLETFQNWSLCRVDKRTFSVHYLTQEWMHNHVMDTQKRDGYYNKIGLHFLKLLGNTHDTQNFNIDYALLAKNYFELAHEIGLKNFAKICFLLEAFYRSLGAYAQAVEVMRSVCDKSKDDETRSAAFNTKGILDMLLGKTDKAFANIQQGLAIRKKRGDLPRLAESYASLSFFYKHEQQYDIAFDYLEQSLEIMEANEDRQGIALILNNMSQILDAQSKYQEAEAYLQKSLIIHHENHDLRGLGIVYVNLGAVAYHLDKKKIALNYLKQAVKSQKKQNDIYDKFKTLELTGNICFELEKYEDATEYLIKAWQWLPYLNVSKKNIEEKLAFIEEIMGAEWMKKKKDSN